MDLYAIALALVLLQCVVLLPEGAFAFQGVLRPTRGLPGPGPRLLHPWPSAGVAVVVRWPFEVWRDRIVAAQSLGTRGSAEPTPPREVALDDAGPIEAAGTLVRWSGRPLARAASPAQARAWAELLARLRAAPEIERALADELARSVSPAGLREALTQARSATRWFALACDGYLAVFLVAPPLLFPLLHPEATWAVIAPLLLSAHVAALILLHASHRRLFPRAAGERFELLASAALYPPALLRAREALLRAQLAGFQPAAAAAALLPRDRCLGFLRRELAHLEYPRGRRAAADRAAREPWVAAAREALLRAGESAGLEASAILAPREASGPDAASYCPVCQDEFFAGHARCTACGVETLPCAPRPG